MPNLLEVQKYLLNGNTLDDLEREYSVSYRIKNGKVSLSYDQLKSPMSEKICQECRGLILREHSWEIVCFPFIKFFNYGEGFAQNINWQNAKVLEKIDGSNLNLYYDNVLKRWFFATRSMPEADGKCEAGITFAEVAQLCLKSMDIDFNELCNKLDKNYTYMFEMVSPYTRVYIYYPEPRLYLLAIRNNLTLKETDPKPLSKIINIPTPTEHMLNDVKTIVFLVNTWKGTEQEGVVVVDNLYNRIKIKNKDYVSGQGLVFSLSASNRNIMQLIMNGHEDDVIPQCPQLIKEKIEDFKIKFIEVIKQVEKDWEDIKHIENQKEFALLAKTKKCSSILFSLKKKQISSVETYLRKNARVDFVLSLCGIKTEKENMVNE